MSQPTQYTVDDGETADRRGHRPSMWRSMPRRLRFWTLILAAVALALTWQMLINREKRREHQWLQDYLKRYNTTALMGLTPAQVQSRLGPPRDQGTDSTGETSWVYQSGMDPDAIIRFRNDRVVKVERLRVEAHP